jgi:hypothetical protein
MSASIWAKTVNLLKEYVVRIETPSGHGTGFVVPAPAGNSDRCIVTAWHVINHANEWQEPIKINHLHSGKQVFLKPDQRMINSAPARDQALIFFSAAELPFPNVDLLFAEEDRHYVEGVEVGWLGFPAVASANQCFFCGHISSYIENIEAYLVDGVAINGVSGGPAFIQSTEEKPIIIGLVTEYHPNLSSGTALPGVSLVRSINPLIKHYKAEQQRTLKEVEVQDIPSGQTDQSPLPPDTKP